MFAVNDKVVCVDDSPSAITGKRPLCKGSVYCVTGFDDLGEDPRNRDKTNGLFLLGVENYHHPRFNVIVGWHPRRFRKVSEVREENRATRGEPQPI